MFCPFEWSIISLSVLTTISECAAQFSGLGISNEFVGDHFGNVAEQTHRLSRRPGSAVAAQSPESILLLLLKAIIKLIASREARLVERLLNLNREARDAVHISPATGDSSR